MSGLLRGTASKQGTRATGPALAHLSSRVSLGSCPETRRVSPEMIQMLPRSDGVNTQPLCREDAGAMGVGGGGTGDKAHRAQAAWFPSTKRERASQFLKNNRMRCWDVTELQSRRKYQVGHCFVASIKV